MNPVRPQLLATPSKASPDRVDIWHVPLEELIASDALPDCHALLSPAERLQEERFRFNSDRNRYRATRASIRVVLSRYSVRMPQDWTFVGGPFGKPRLVEAHEWTPPLEFNISHSNDAIVIAIGWGRQLGIDVEVAGREVEHSVIRACLTAREQAAHDSLPPNLRLRRFIDLWTLKESYLKARGDGLNVPPRQFGFGLENDDIHFFAADIDQSERRWSFLQLELSPRHVVALCTDERLQRICIRTTVPLRHDLAAKWLILRRSISLANVEIGTS